MQNAVIEKNAILEEDVEELLNKAELLINNTLVSINYELINLYWNIGKMIVEYRRHNNSKYGDAVVSRFSIELSLRYGKGFDSTNISRMIKFYRIFSKVAPAQQFKNISWSHIVEILKIKDMSTINYYLDEVSNKSLTKLELRNNIKLKSYERTISNQRKGTIKNDIEKTLKDPVILNIQDKKRSEKELEDEIFINIINFMKEIGNNIFFSGRQYKIINNGLRYRVDLVLYDKDNKCYILIDLKINKVGQRDISQMKFYVDYFNENIKDDTDKKTIGLILVETKDVRVENREDIYQIKYLNELLKEKELLKIINENKIILLKTDNLKLSDKK